MPNPPNRVLQLDGHLLDNEVFDSLNRKLHDAFSSGYLPIGVQQIANGDTLNLLLRLALFKVTVWDKSTTYGLALQNLQLSDGSSRSGISKPRKLLLLFAIIARYLYKRLESYSYETVGGSGAGAGAGAGWVSKLAAKLARLADKFSKLYATLTLANFLLFLVRGKYPTLSNRLLGITYRPLSSTATSLASNPQTISYEFQDRQLVWNTLTEFLAFTLPMISVPKLARAVRRVVTGGSGKRTANRKPGDGGILRFLPVSCCAICYQNAVAKSKQEVAVEDNLVTNPYITSCGHVYCYYCIVNKLDEHFDPDDPDSCWTCLRCGDPVNYCQPYNGGFAPIKEE